MQGSAGQECTVCGTQCGQSLAHLVQAARVKPDTFRCHQLLIGCSLCFWYACGIPQAAQHVNDLTRMPSAGDLHDEMAAGCRWRSQLCMSQCQRHLGDGSKQQQHMDDADNSGRQLR